MKKILFFLLLSTSVFAQNLGGILPMPGSRQVFNFTKSDSSIFKDKLHYGGNLWLGFFGSFYIDASPMIGYEIGNKRTIVGTGLSVIYQGAYNQLGAFAAGVRLFVRQPIYKSVFVHGEYEMMNAANYRFYDAPIDPTTGASLATVGRKWGGSPLVGLGFYQGRGGQQKGSFISIMYNLGAPSFGFISPQGLGGNRSPYVLRYGFFF